MSEVEKVVLSEPNTGTPGSFEGALARRRTRREFKAAGITLAQLSQILWAAEGVTDLEHGYRTTPSGGAMYPLTVYAVAGEGGVAGLPAGLYRHEVGDHGISQIRVGDLRSEIDRTMFDHPWVAAAPVNIIIAARYQVMLDKFGPLGSRYADMEIGHMAENICLQAVALGLGAGLVVAFDGGKLGGVLGLGRGEEPIYSLPVGHPR